MACLSPVDDVLFVRSSAANYTFWNHSGLEAGCPALQGEEGSDVVCCWCV